MGTHAFPGPVQLRATTKFGAVDPLLELPHGGRYPRTKLEMEPELRSRKRGKFGAVKYVYPPDDMRVLRAWFTEELERRMPAARLLYWT